MAHNLDTRQSVRADFVKGMPLKAAAANNDVAYQTARGWKRNAKNNGDDWDVARAALRISGDGASALTAAVIEDFVLLFQSTLESIKVAKDIPPMEKARSIAMLSDAYQKTIKAAGSSSAQLSRLSVVMDVLQKQMAFIRKRFPQYTDAFIEVLEPLGEELSRECA